MYKLVIILRYLRRKLTPMFAAGAVMLCTAMVIIVISVMGGFLEMLRDSTRKLEGDVTIRAGVAGFPHYEKLLAKVRAMPQVQAATPVVRSFGLINLSDRVHTIEVLGIEPKSMDEVVGFAQRLKWDKSDLLNALKKQMGPMGDLSPAQRAYYEKKQQEFEAMDLKKFGMDMQAPADWSKDGKPAPGTPGNPGAAPSQPPPQAGEGKGHSVGIPGGIPGIVLGIAVSPYNTRDSKGKYDILNNNTLGRQVTLTVLPITKQGGLLEPAARRMAVVNEFHSGLYEVDANRVYVSFDQLQKMLRMDGHELVDQQTGMPTGQMVSGRASFIMIRGKPGIDVIQLRTLVDAELDRFRKDHPDLPPMDTQTWQERHATFLAAVEKEKNLLTFLFGFISVVAVAMIAVIFYMIVLEKTRDIGVLRAIGASRWGILNIFLGYGLAVGLVGAFLGFWLAAAVVWNINWIQDQLTSWFGVTVWNPEIYYFDRVPEHMNPTEITIILAVAVLSSVVGAIIPAILAARLNPVESLRYE